MKKVLSTIILLSVLIFPAVVALETLAQTQRTPAPPPVTTTQVDPIEVLKRIVDWVFYILLIFAALMIVVAAYYFVAASGDPEKVKTARNFVLYAIIGVIVAFLAKGLVWLAGKITGQEILW